MVAENVRNAGSQINAGTVAAPYVWHPILHDRYHSGGTAFYFLSSFYYAALKDELQALIEDFGIASYSRYSILGPRDIILAVHEPGGPRSFREAMTSLARGYGADITMFQVQGVERYLCYDVPARDGTQLDVLEPDELNTVQNGEATEEVETVARATKILLGDYRAVAQSVHAFTVVSFVVPEQERIDNTIQMIRTQFPNDDGTLRSIYRGVNYGSILLEWTSDDAQTIHDSVLASFHNSRGRIRTDTFVVGRPDVDKFNLIMFRPDTSTVFSRLQRMFPAIDSLTQSVQTQVSAEATFWIPLFSRSDGLPARVFDAMIQLDPMLQSLRVIELSRYLEAALRSHVSALAEARWGAAYVTHLTDLTKPPKPLNRWTLGNFVESGGKFLKEERDKGELTALSQDDIGDLRAFAVVRNDAAHYINEEDPMAVSDDLIKNLIVVRKAIHVFLTLEGDGHG